ncbi:MAG: DNA mismatch repair endonuclease MutL [Prevotellaceae bacterium]|jgi:DNA mismatch repair protein MutL|nr:DNA mismatch repair endonuclease MutL [Prevotellaceae bacterium]
MIKLLPDNVANQIAAGEVVQRPASVVKELMENAVDAGSTQINLVIKDAGRTLIQVTDSGCGMSDTDARMAFERHATSKIADIRDLDSIKTFGFRGEALASIAAVAEVELKTRLKDEDLGVRLLISASKVMSSEPVQCATGSSFSVKNLFYNIPARRKFLKTDASELKQIINEFQRVAICNTNIEFNFYNNSALLYNLPAGNLKQRLSGIFGKNIATALIDVNIATSIVKVYGFTGKADKAKKSQGEQFFFVNNRFFRSPYLQKAVYKAYEQLLPSDMHPSFFLFLDINPANIDINIHPQKTEVKFEDEHAIWKIVNAVVRESLSKYAVAPSIIFDMEGAPDIPVLEGNTQVSTPEIAIDESYNPFKSSSRKYSQPDKIDGWEQLYTDFNKQSGMPDVSRSEPEPDFESEPELKQKIAFDGELPKKRFLQLKDRYIATPVKSGLMLVDICRAHQRILFEEFLRLFQSNSVVVSQKQLFPEMVELSPSDCMLIQGVWDDLEKMGFEIRNFNDSIMFYALPAGLEKANAKNILDEILVNIKEDYGNSSWNTQEKLALSLAKSESVKKCGILNDIEMEHLINRLFACKMPDIDTEGKPTISIIEIDKIFTE